MVSISVERRYGNTLILSSVTAPSIEQAQFVYDEKLNVFRFPEDGRFAFCEEFVDWRGLEKLGYLDF
jgi:hypothetical protein